MPPESGPTSKTLTFEEMNSRYAGRWVIAEDLDDGTNGIVLGTHSVEAIANNMARLPGSDMTGSEIKYRVFLAGAPTT